MMDSPEAEKSSPPLKKLWSLTSSIMTEFQSLNTESISQAINELKIKSSISDDFIAESLCSNSQDESNKKSAIKFEVFDEGYENIFSDERVANNGI